MLQIDYEYIIKHYHSKCQIQYYEERARIKGLSEAEETLIKKYANTNDKLLDVGTGCGRWAIGASRLGYTNITAIDMNKYFISKAVDISNELKESIIYLVQNAESTIFSENTFDYIMFSSDGFSQIPGNQRKLKVLTELFRILKPGGILVIAVIDEKAVAKNDKRYYEHLTRFRELKLYERYGFDNENDIFITDGGYMHFADVEETLELFSQAKLEVIYHRTAESILGHKDSKSSNYSRFFIATK